MGNGMMGGKSRYLLVLVGFLKTVVSMDLSGLCKIRTSREGNWDLASISNVNFMVALMVLTWLWKSSTRSDLRMQQVSSTYLFQNLGGLG